MVRKLVEGIQKVHAGRTVTVSKARILPRPRRRDQRVTDHDQNFVDEVDRFCSLRFSISSGPCACRRARRSPRLVLDGLFLVDGHR